jgi:hypothetical protein
MFRTETGNSQLLGFNNFLKVDTTLFQDESANAELPVTVKFTVTNLALNDPLYVEILFDEVILHYGTSTNWQVAKFNNLSPGHAFVVDFKCRFKDLTEIHFEVEGQVSSERFFKTNLKVQSLLHVQNRLTSLAYLQVFNDIKIHHWFEDTIKKFLAPDTSISLAELKTKDELLKTIIKEIEGIEHYMDDY